MYRAGLTRRCLAYLLFLLVTFVAACGGGVHGGSAAPIVSPAGLNFSDPSVVYVRGIAITPNTPSSSGGAITKYSISPTLPAGLSLDPQTGAITGTPAAVTPAALYTVTGSNTAGNDTARLEIEVKDHAVAPETFSYPDNPVIYTAGVAIIPNAPVTSGGEITEYGVTPALPAGLVLNAQTGVISGTPTAVSAATDYTVTGSNSAGSLSTVLNIAVQAQVVPPAALTYSNPEPVYTAGQPIVDNVPQASGGAITRYTVSPALPAGLAIDALTGIVSGTPAHTQASTVYTVTGSNSVGSVTATIAITVLPDLSGTWLPADSMNQARSQHTATLLTIGPSAGSVLVAGGYNPGYLGSAELYNPLTGAWSVTGGMRETRRSHTATELSIGPNAGEVLVAGGYNGTYLNSAELYDPPTATWATTGSMSQARESHTATLLTTGPNAGEVLVAGGTTAGTGALSSAELYNPATGTWSTTGNMNEARSLHTATLLTTGPNAGKVLITGGVIGSVALSSAELYDPVAGTWSTTGSMSMARSQHTATLLTTGPNAGDVLVAGGFNGSIDLSSAELYNPVTGTWSTTGSMNEAREIHTAALLTTGPNAGKVLVAGGFNGSTDELSSAELYDPATGTWSTTGSMSVARDLHTATVLTTGPNAGKVLIAGGSPEFGVYLSSAELFVP
jgi:hypothetical protein